MNAEQRRAMLVAEVEDLTALLEQDGLMVTGSKGQPVAHPAIALRHSALEQLRRIDAQTPPQPLSDPLSDFLAL